MLALGAYGIGPAVPRVAVGDTPDIRAALLRQAAALLEGQRAATRPGGRAHAVSPPPADPRATLPTNCSSCGQAVFGGEVRDAAQLHLRRRRRDRAQRARWPRAPRSRAATRSPSTAGSRASRASATPVARLGACLRGAEVLATGDRLALSVAQLPFAQRSAGWVCRRCRARSWPAEQAVDGGSVVGCGRPRHARWPACSSTSGSRWCPTPTETTALTFQFDPPNAFAPQNVLVAVPPVPGQDWTTETPAPGARGDPRPGEAARGRLRACSAPPRSTCPRSTSPSTPPIDAVSTDFAPLTTIAGRRAPQRSRITAPMPGPSSQPTRAARSRATS